MKPLTTLLAGSRIAIWPIAELVAAIAAQLVLTPLLLLRLDAPQFAVWVLAQSTLLASATLSLGTGIALLPALASAHARQDTVGAWWAIRLFAKRTTVMTSLLFGVICLALAALDVSSWLPTMQPMSKFALATATLAWLAATELDSGFTSALKSIGRFSQVAQLEVVSRAAQVVLTLTLVSREDGALMPIVVAATTTLAKLTVKFFALRRYWPMPAPGAPRCRSDTIDMELRSAGPWVWLGVMSGLSFNAFDRWFIGAWLGPSALASYAVCSQLAQIPHAFVSAAGQTLVPWAARHRATLEEPAVGRRARRIVLLATAAAALPSLLFMPLVHSLLSRWVSPQFAAEYSNLAQSLLLVYFAMSLNAPSYFLLFGFGKARTSTTIIGMAGGVFVAGCLLIPPSINGFVAMKMVFALLTLGLVAQLLILTRKSS